VNLHFQACVFWAVLTAPVAFGQANPVEPVKVVTVCDILLDPSSFNGKSMVVLGRLSASDEGLWLVEEKCDRKVDTKNGGASNIMVWLEHRGRGPSPPLAMPLIDQDSLRAKLEQAGKTTKLGKHVQYQCTISYLEKDARPQCGWPEVNDEWAIVYGKVETIGDREYGYGHLSGAPAQVVYQGLVLSIDENGHPRHY
jgi:hypothetical protein